MPTWGKISELNLASLFNCKVCALRPRRNSHSPPVRCTWWVCSLKAWHNRLNRLVSILGLYAMDLVTKASTFTMLLSTWFLSLTVTAGNLTCLLSSIVLKIPFQSAIRGRLCFWQKRSVTQQSVEQGSNIPWVIIKEFSSGEYISISPTHECVKSLSPRDNIKASDSVSWNWRQAVCCKWLSDCGAISVAATPSLAGSTVAVAVLWAPELAAAADDLSDSLGFCQQIISWCFIVQCLHFASPRGQFATLCPGVKHKWHARSFFNIFIIFSKSKLRNSGQYPRAAVERLIMLFMLCTDGCIKVTVRFDTNRVGSESSLQVFVVFAWFSWSCWFHARQPEADSAEQVGSGILDPYSFLHCQ